MKFDLLTRLSLGCGVAAVCLTQNASASQPKQQPVSVPVRYKNAHSGSRADVESRQSSRWWEIFKDSTLNRLEDTALTANQDLRQAIARIEEARQGTRIAASGFYPHAQIDLGVSRNRTTNSGPIQSAELAGSGAAAFGGGQGGQPPAFSSQLLTSTFNNFRAPLVLSYEVDVFGRIRHQYGSAREQLAAAKADRAAVELSLTGEVASAYFSLRALDSQVDILRRAVAVRKEAVDVNSERVSEGIATDLDLSRARVELDNTQADLENAIRLRAQMENALAALCGEAASDFHVAAQPLENITPPGVPAGVPSQLLTRRPDLMEAQHRVTAASEQIGVARANMLPSLQLQGDFGYESAQFNKTFDDQSHVWGVAGVLSIPVFEGGRNRANLGAAKARREETLAEYRSKALKAIQEVEDALVALRQRAAEAQARNRSTNDAEDVVKLSRKRYIEGAVKYFEVVDAERTHLNFDLLRVQTLNARYGATIALIKAIGGSW
jgi:multidrug efflux system outer membrane protein